MSANNIESPEAIEKEIQQVLHKAYSYIGSNRESEGFQVLIVALFFLKRISDIWEEQNEVAGQKTPGDPTVTSAIFSGLSYQLPFSSQFQFLYENRTQPGNGQRIEEAFHALEQSNMSLFSEMLDWVNSSVIHLKNTPKEDETLRGLLEIIASPELNLRPSRIIDPDVIGRTFTYLLQKLSNFSASGDLSLTPGGLSDLMVRLVSPKKGDAIYDPCCGTGSLLLQCARYIREQDPDAGQQYALFGQEKSLSACSLSKIHLYMNNQQNHRIAFGDSIRTPQLVDSNGQLKQFDVVISHPPFASTDWGMEMAKNDQYGRFKYGIPPKSKGDFAFIQHMLASLDRKNGRMAVVVPLGVLFRSGADAEIRQRIIESNLLDSIIALPEKLFPNTSIPVAILVFRSKKQDDCVLFIDATEQRKTGRGQNQLTDANIKHILDLYLQRTSNDTDAFLATMDDIRSNDFNCSVQRYVRPNIQEEIIDIGAVRQQEKELFQEIKELGNNINSSLDELGYTTKGN